MLALAKNYVALYWQVGNEPAYRGRMEHYVAAHILELGANERLVHRPLKLRSANGECCVEWFQVHGASRR